MPLCKCAYHPDQPITNFCQQAYLPLCPLCIKIQSRKVQALGNKVDFEVIDVVWNQTRSHLMQNSMREILFSKEVGGGEFKCPKLYAEYTDV
jgi:hypothetical protein